jgi:hypothetical protein
VDAHLDELLKSGLVPVERMAEALGVEPKRFLGYMVRNKVGDPIGDGKEVYGWSCATLAERLPNIKEPFTAAQGSSTDTSGAST